LLLLLIIIFIANRFSLFSLIFSLFFNFFCLDITHGRCVTLFWTARLTARKYALQRVFKRFPEVAVEVGVYQRVQRRIEITDPKQHRHQCFREATRISAQGRYHVPANILLSLLIETIKGLKMWDMCNLCQNYYTSTDSETNRYGRRSQNENNIELIDLPC